MIFMYYDIGSTVTAFTLFIDNFECGKEGSNWDWSYALEGRDVGIIGFPIVPFIDDFECVEGVKFVSSFSNVCRLIYYINRKKLTLIKAVF